MVPMSAAETIRRRPEPCHFELSKGVGSVLPEDLAGERAMIRHTMERLPKP